MYDTKILIIDQIPKCYFLTKLLVPADDLNMRSPTFSQPLTDLEIPDGSQLILQCTVNGDPEPQINWTRNGKQISSSEIIDLKYKNGVAKLTINEVFPEDAAKYTCTATNSIGSESTSCHLRVKSKFTINSSEIR